MEKKLEKKLDKLENPCYTVGVEIEAGKTETTTGGKMKDRNASMMQRVDNKATATCAECGRDLTRYMCYKDLKNQPDLLCDACYNALLKGTLSERKPAARVSKYDNTDVNRPDPDDSRLRSDALDDYADMG